MHPNSLANLTPQTAQPFSATNQPSRESKSVPKRVIISNRFEQFFDQLEKEVGGKKKKANATLLNKCLDKLKKVLLDEETRPEIFLKAFEFSIDQYAGKATQSLEIDNNTHEIKDVSEYSVDNLLFLVEFAVKELVEIRKVDVGAYFEEKSIVLS